MAGISYQDGVHLAQTWFPLNKDHKILHKMINGQAMSKLSFCGKFMEILEAWSKPDFRFQKQRQRLMVIFCHVHLLRGHSPTFPGNQKNITHICSMYGLVDHYLSTFTPKISTFSPKDINILPKDQKIYGRCL